MWPQSIYDNVPPWQVTPESCDERYPITNDDATLVAPGCDPFFSGLAHDLTDYDAALESLIAGPFAATTLAEAVDRHAAFISAAVAAEPRGQTMERWQSELSLLKSNIPRLQARARARRGGFTASALDLSVSSVNDFEGLDSAMLGLLPSFSNSATATRLALEGAEPALEGRQSLLLSFEYRNEGVIPWSHWINLGLPFQARP